MNTLEALIALGLNDLEARIYIHLLSESPATGYRIARAIDKPTANTYKALETLIKKGAVECNDGNKRLFKPSPPHEFIQRLRRYLQSTLDTAENELKEIKSRDNDLRIYQMDNCHQVMERAESIMRKARKVIIADIFPVVLTRLAGHLKKAADRKIEVSVKCYQPIYIPGVKLGIESRGNDIPIGYPGQWLKVVADGRAHIIAFLSNDLKEVYQAIWSESPFLSVLHFNAIRSEMLLDQINAAARQKNNSKSISRILKSYNPHAKKLLPGYTDLINISGELHGGHNEKK